MNSEVLIIGGGIIGLSIAREFHKKGVNSITVLDRNQIGKEASYAAAGMLVPHAETVRKDDFYYFCDDSSKTYPQFAAQLFDETNIDIELDQSGMLFIALNENDSKEVRERFEIQKNSGMDVQYLTAQQTRQIEPFVSPDILESYFFPNDWQVENRKIIDALRKYCELNKIELKENVEVTELIFDKGKVSGVRAFGGEFFAPIVVIATGAWTSFIKIPDLELPTVKPIRGQIIAYQTAKRLFQKVIFTPRGYLVPRADGRVLIGATVEDAGFDKSMTAEGIEALQKVAVEMSPNLINLKISEQWAGLRPFAADGLPILGSFLEFENLYIATAHYRNGILLAPLTAKILAEKAFDDVNSKYLEIFNVRRFYENGN